jgi:hypothetical protein
MFFFLQNPDTAPEGFISKDIYILSYIQKSAKRIFSILFWSGIFWGYNFLILGISKYHIHILSYILFSTFSARDLPFPCCTTALIDQGFKIWSSKKLTTPVLPGLAFHCSETVTMLAFYKYIWWLLEQKDILRIYIHILFFYRDSDRI